MKEFLKNPKFHRGFLSGVLILATAVLVYSLWALTVEFQTYRYMGYLRRERVNHLRGRSQFRADQIAGWMTFKYINLIFNLPPEYLKNQLKVSDRRYPNLSVDEAAKSQKQDRAKFLQKTIEAIKAYSVKPLAQ